MKVKRNLRGKFFGTGKYFLFIKGMKNYSRNRHGSAVPDKIIASS
jgi:hypothetical protein